MNVVFNSSIENHNGLSIRSKRGKIKYSIAGKYINGYMGYGVQYITID